MFHMVDPLISVVDNIRLGAVEAAGLADTNQPAGMFTTIAQLRLDLDHLEAACIDVLRQKHGHTWSSLAGPAGVTRPAIRARYNRRAGLV